MINYVQEIFIRLHFQLFIKILRNKNYKQKWKNYKTSLKQVTISWEESTKGNFKYFNLVKFIYSMDNRSK